MDIKKLYIAILSKGWWRSEIGFEVLPAMLRTKGVQITLRSPRKSWAVPHYNNRNIICRDFLQTDSDFLLMMDHDIVPLSNPAELVLANKDIIGTHPNVYLAVSSALVKTPWVDNGMRERSVSNIIISSLVGFLRIKINPQEKPNITSQRFPYANLR